LIAAQEMNRTSIMINPDVDLELLRGLASPVRIRILNVLRSAGRINVKELSRILDLPQSTTASNVSALEEAGLIGTEIVAARKGQQKYCWAKYDDILVRFNEPPSDFKPAAYQVVIPIGLFTKADISPPCGLCSSEHMIGAENAPESFFDPSRTQAARMWFQTGVVEYEFPIEPSSRMAPLTAVEFSLEITSGTRGKSVRTKTDITAWVNRIPVGTWLARETQEGSGRSTEHQSDPLHGTLKTWRIEEHGTFLDRTHVSDASLVEIGVTGPSLRFRIGVDEKAEHHGGVSIFGRGLGRYGQDVVMKIYRAG
jgi:predicted transcriptional regulator